MWLKEGRSVTGEGAIVRDAGKGARQPKQTKDKSLNERKTKQKTGGKAVRVHHENTASNF
jgi:hypothetical protein